VFVGALKNEPGGTFSATFDEVKVCPAGTCGNDLGDQLEPSELFDFVFRVRIGGVQARLEPADSCLPETVCLSGALPGRTEVMLRIIGPRPNGYLWFQAVRFTPAAVTIEAWQVSTNTRRHYLLAASTPDERPTSIEDRVAFLP
jgi:hypothetical protein